MTEPTAEPHDPTELAGVAEANTESAYAWGLADTPDDPLPRRRFSPIVVTITAVAVSLLVVIGVAIFGGYKLASRGQAAQPQVAASPSAPTPAATPAIAKAPFYGEWSRHGLNLTLAPDGTAQYSVWLGVANESTWSATWSPMTEMTAMVVLKDEIERRGDVHSSPRLEHHSGEALTFTLRTGDYATITEAGGRLVNLCHHTAGFRDTRGLCGA